MLLRFYNSKKEKEMLVKNKYKFITKSKLKKLQADFALVEKSAPSKERTAAMILLNAKIMRQENINNKK